MSDLVQDLVIDDNAMRALLVAERDARKSEVVLQEYEEVEGVEYGERDWMAVTAEQQRRIAEKFCTEQGLPGQNIAKVVRMMRVAVHKPQFADAGLPQQWPINRARRGNLIVGESPPTVCLGPVMVQPADGGDGYVVRVGQALQFPVEVCQKPYTIVVAGSYS